MNRIEYKGYVYSSEKDLCRHLDINYENYLERKEKGLPLEECVKRQVTKPENIIYKGEKYSSEKELCKDLGITYCKYKEYREKVSSIDEAIELYGTNVGKFNSSKKSKYIYNGIDYKNRPNFEVSLGISNSRKRMKKYDDIELVVNGTKAVALGIPYMNSSKLTEFINTLDLSKKYNLEWKAISRNKNLTVAIIRKYKNKLDWDIISATKQDMTVKFIEEFKDYINYNLLLRNCNVPEEYILNNTEKFSIRTYRYFLKYRNDTIYSEALNKLNIAYEYYKNNINHAYDKSSLYSIQDMLYIHQNKIKGSFRENDSLNFDIIKK